MERASALAAGFQPSVRTRRNRGSQPAVPSQQPGRAMIWEHGGLAQLGERLAGSQKVRGSSPLSSTPPHAQGVARRCKHAQPGLDPPPLRRHACPRKLDQSHQGLDSKSWSSFFLGPLYVSRRGPAALRAERTTSASVPPPLLRQVVRARATSLETPRNNWYLSRHAPTSHASLGGVAPGEAERRVWWLVQAPSPNRRAGGGTTPSSSESPQPPNGGGNRGGSMCASDCDATSLISVTSVFSGTFRTSAGSHHPMAVFRGVCEKRFTNAVFSSIRRASCCNAPADEEARI